MHCGGGIRDGVMLASSKLSGFESELWIDITSVMSGHNVTDLSNEVMASSLFRSLIFQ